MTRSVSRYPALGPIVKNWQPPSQPQVAPMRGQFVRLAPLDAGQHANQLYSAFDGHDQVWDFLPYGPFDSAAELEDWITDTVTLPNHQFFAVSRIEPADCLGVCSYLNIAPNQGSIEVGHINYSPALQGTIAATEAMYLMMCWVFDAGYRRYEWKCNALNMASRRAAQRLGFSYEGVFRQAAVVKGRNRDTAWFAIIDSEWPALKNAFNTWLSPQNFENGVQIAALSDLTRPLLAATDPDL